MSIDAAATSLRAAAHLDSASTAAREAMAMAMPRIFGRGAARERIAAHFSVAIADARRAIAELEGAGAPMAEVRARIQRAVDHIDPSRHEDIAYVRRFGDMKSEVEQLAIQRDALRLHAEHAHRPAADVRAMFQAEADGMLDAPLESFRTPLLRRIAVLHALPGDVAPSHPRLVRDWHAFHRMVGNGWEGDERAVVAELHNLQIERARRRLVADPATSAPALDAEVRGLLARPHEELGHAELDRISILAGLGDDLRPRVLDAPDPWPRPLLPLDQLGSWRYGFRPSDGQVRARLDAIRRGIEVEAMAADPALTREAVTSEVVGILSMPTAELDRAALQRLGTLLTLPEQLRPALPRAVDSHYVIENLGLLDAVPSKHMTAARIYDRARTELLADLEPGVLVDEVRARVARGDDIDLGVVSALAHRDPDLLARAGVSDEALRERALAALAAGHKATGEDVAGQLEYTRAGIARLRPDDPAQSALRDELLDLIDRNVARVRGLRSDTFGRHPDYAEVGRIVESSRLLHVLADATPATSKTRAHAPAREATEVLAW